MARHFIYEDNSANNNRLFQGDVLRRSPELVKILEDYHGHYAHHDRYLYFLVLTQSCDLTIRDDGKPNSPYITIAAVRPIEDALFSEAKKHQQDWQDSKHILFEKSADKLRMFTGGLINNNLTNYFYLHDDIPIIQERCCAFLALSVAIRSQHYDICCKAKIAQLKESFQARLGWQVGNIYSRVATPDWEEQYGKTASKAASEFVKEFFVTFTKEKFDYANKQFDDDLRDFSSENILQALKKKKMPAKLELFSKRLREVLSNSSFVDKMCSSVIKEIPTDVILSKTIRVAIEDSSITADEKVGKLLDIFRRHMADHFTDKTYSERQKIIDYLASVVGQDTVIRKYIS